MEDLKLTAFARYKGTDEEVFVESGTDGHLGIAQELMVIRFKIHDEAIRKALAESGCAIVPINNLIKIERIGDQSISLTFPSCRSASEFEKAISNENNHKR